MRVRALVLVVALGLAGGLSGCGIDDLRSERRHGGPMRMTMVSSEANYLAEMIPHHGEAVRAAGDELQPHAARGERHPRVDVGRELLVGGDDDDRALAEPQLLQPVEDPAHLVVDEAHRGVVGAACPPTSRRGRRASR